MLNETLRNDFNAARKSGDTVKKQAIEAVLSAILLKEKSAKDVQIADADILAILTKEIKVQNEITELYRTTHPEKSAEAAGKAAVLSAYLPAQMTDEEVLERIRALDVYGDASGKTKGAIIKALMPEINGKYDKSKVNGLIERYFSTK